MFTAFTIRAESSNKHIATMPGITIQRNTEIELAMALKDFGVDLKDYVVIESTSTHGDFPFTWTWERK